MMNGYEGALAGRFGGQTEKNHRPKLIREILDRAVHRKWRQLAQERIENVKPSIPLGRRFWALTKSERKALKELLKSDSADSPLHGFAVKALALSGYSQTGGYVTTYINAIAPH